jgi:signal transduction histidine kinase
LIYQDFGIGIDLNRNRDKVFGLYQRFHNYPDSKGLGLYLVKSQVEAMGGTISIESEVDKGTTFTLIFKINNMMLDLILCVDDDPITLMLQKK